MRNKCPNIRVLQGPIYTRAKMPVYAGLANMAAVVKWLVLLYLLFNVCYCSSHSQ